jgi:tetratricopeptide (TPR) repeat protein
LHFDAASLPGSLCRELHVHEIFISYSSKHRDLTRALAAAIEAQYGAGSVWWDHELESRASYSEQIKAALEKARVVVVVWTAGAMISDYVYAEAVEAQAAGKLVNVRPADMSFRQIPEPFNIHHIDDAEDHARIMATIAKVMAGTPIQTRVPLHEIYRRQTGRLLIDPKQSRLARDPREILPTDLLQAKYAVVPYVDVTGMKADLTAWCRDGARVIAGRLVHGPGGLGKTRLMIEVAAALHEGGWTAGFLDRPQGLAEGIVQQRWQALDQLIAHGEDAGLLMVMDYAEARQDEVKAIADRLSRRPEDDTRPIRVVLLTRTAGEWWTTLHDETPDIQRLFRRDARGPGVVALQAIATPDQRRELFFASALAMAPTLAAQGYANPTSQPSLDRLRRIENDADHARPLAVQMEALLWLTSAAPEAGPIRIDKLLECVLGLERDHWGKLLGALDEDRKRDIARGVAQATVVLGTNSKPSTERLLMADGFYGKQREARVAVDPVLRGLTRMYCKPDDAGVWQLEPDLIGEHHVAMTADPELIDGCLAWIDTEPVEMREKRRRDLITVLQRGTHPDHGAAIARATALLDHLVGTRTRGLAAEMVAVVIDTPGALLHRLEKHLAEFDRGTLFAVDDALPLRSLGLMEFSLHVAIRRADVVREICTVTDAMTGAPQGGKEVILSHLAASLDSLANRLSKFGQREEAVGASQEAVNIFRRLATAKPDAFLPELARILNNFAAKLSNLGHREEALAALQEAVAIDRQLAESRPDTSLRSLAACLNNLSIELAALGRREEAVAASQDAVAIYRGLAATRPDAFSPDLATSLGNLGLRLSDLGRREEALAVSQEAVAAYRRLVETRPDAFLPDLALHLDNLGEHLAQLGQLEAALVASQEAIVIYRRLTETRPDAFLPGLAGICHNLSIRLSNLGRREEALAASQEAITIDRRLADTHPDAFLPDLAKSLMGFGKDLSNLGHREAALRPLQEAVDIHRRLSETHPDAFLPNLAASLNSLSVGLSRAHQPQVALKVCAEAVDIYWRLVKVSPDAFLPELALCLNNLGEDFSTLGGHEEALEVSRGAADIYRQLAEGRPDAFLPNLAMSLNNLGVRFIRLRQSEEALAPSQEAVDIYRRLSETHPAAFLPDLAACLRTLGLALVQWKRHSDAVSTLHEGLAVVAPFVEEHPQAFGDLVSGLCLVARFNEFERIF